MMKLERSYGIVTIHHMAVISMVNVQLQKCFGQASIGPPFLKMLMIMKRIVISDRGREEFPREMRCH